MKETRFIAQNKEKWLESENLLTQERKEPEKLSNLFTQVVDDLSYSRTYYPNRSVKVYLNKIAREYFSIIYSRQRDRKNAFRLFWTDELPQVIIHCRKELIVALLFFCLSVAIGVFSSMKDPEFANAILGDQYVAMTKANIEKGDPMAVYKSGSEIDMFLGITLHNVRLSFYIYAFGIFLSIGSLGMLMYNGIMVGCFQYFFIERGLFAESALTIWLHGTPEMASFILASGAGITLGKGLVFPGTYSRLQAFQISAVRSLKLMLGIAPILIVSGFIESFITRYTDMPDFIRLLLILTSLAFIVEYFVIYPWLKSRSGFEVPLKEVKIAPSADEPVDYKVIKNTAEILKDGFLFYKKNFSKMFPWILGVSIVVGTARWLALDELLHFRFLGGWWERMFTELFFAMETPNVFFIVINALATSVVLYVVYRLIANDASGTREPFRITFFLGVLLLMLAVYGILYSLGGWGVFILLFTYVCFMLAAYTPMADRAGFTSGIARSWNLFGADYSQVFILHIVLLLIVLSCMVIFSAPLAGLYVTIFKWNFARADTWINNVLFFVEVLIKVMAFYMTLPIIAACSAYLYYSMSEIMDASNLRESIEGFGTQKRTYERK